MRVGAIDPTSGSPKQDWQASLQTERGWFHHRYSRLRVKGNAVSFTVRNVGRRTGRTVAALYVTIPSPHFGVIEPPHQLKAFKALRLRRGHSKRVRLVLDSRAVAYWDVSHNRWAVAPGCFTIAVGRSSRDLPLHASVARGGGRCAHRRR